MSDAAKSKAKQRRAIEKPKLDDARQLRGIFFIEHEDEEFNRTKKTARRKLEIPMPAAMLCKTPTNCRGETCRNIRNNKTRDACTVDADESMRISLEGAPHRYHEDHISAKGINSLSHHNRAKVYSHASSIDNTRCEGNSGKTMVKNGEDTGMTADESQKQKRGDR